MSQQGEVPDCMFTCPVDLGATLGDLQARYAPQAGWLFSAPQDRQADDYFTPEAVATAHRYYDLEVPPNSPGYGTPKSIDEPSLIEIWTTEHTVQAGLHVGVRQIKQLQHAARQREKRHRQYAAQPAERRQELAAAARPFLEKLASDVLQRPPGLEVYAEVAATTQEHELPPFAALAGGFDSLTGIDRLHHLDQAPYIAAAMVLAQCNGPWQISRPRLFGAPRTVQICPSGRRTVAYFQAEAAQAMRKYGPQEDAQA